jgi:hypothetical protein
MQFPDFRTRLQHENYCKHLIASKQLDVPYLSYIAQFRKKLSDRTITDYIWNDRSNGFAVVFASGETDNFRTTNASTGGWYRSKGLAHEPMHGTRKNS